MLQLFFVHAIYAQKEGYFWYFGKYAGLDFNSGTAVAVTNGAMSTWEGCATISDKDGNLLFYTNGITVWNKKHLVMQNGNGLNGHSSSTQSAVIIPYPDDPTQFYIFTVDAEAGPNGFQYSLVDLKKDNGLGAINKRNEFVTKDVCEKITAVHHANAKDIWIIIHKWNSSDFYAYLVTVAGLQKPVISSVGSMHLGNIVSAAGYLKVSSDGKYIACVKSGTAGDCQVFKFNNVTGEITNPITLGPLVSPYGVEFSPNSRFVYLADNNSLIQYDLSLGSEKQINDGRILIESPGVALGAFQIAPDKKIYITKINQNGLAVIGAPDQKGKNCQFIKNHIDMVSGVCQMGLPTFIQSYFEIRTGFNYKGTCLGETTKFTGNSSINPDRWQWYFGDPVSGKNDSSTLQNPEHIFKKPGTYKVKLIVFIGEVKDTTVQDITINESPYINLGPDTVLCPGDTITLIASTDNYRFTWNTGATSASLKISQGGKYWVRATSGNCVATDAIEITAVQELKMLGNDTIVCLDKPFWLKPLYAANGFEWSNGSTADSVEITTSGNYWLRSKISSCYISDTIKITVLPVPQVNLGPDEILCEGTEKTLDAQNPQAEFLWNTNQRTQVINVPKFGRYWVLVRAANCIDSDTIEFTSCPAIVNFPNAFTPNNDTLNDFFHVYGSDISGGRLVIHNRWGECLYNSEDIFTGWDGKFNGKACPVGTYTWTFYFKEHYQFGGYPKVMHGTVQLLK